MDTNSEAPESSPSKPKAPKKRPVKILVVILLAAVAISQFSKPQGDPFAFDSIDAEQALSESTDPISFLDSLWQTGKISQRRFVILSLRNKANDETRPDWQKYLLEKTYTESISDPDIQVRELMLSALNRIHSMLKDTANLSEGPEKEDWINKAKELENNYIIPACLFQILDPDPGVKAMGIRFANRVLQKDILVSPIYRLLDTPNPTLLSQSAAYLRNATGENFGILFKDLPTTEPANEIPAIKEKLAKWISYMSEHEDKFIEATKKIKRTPIQTVHLSHDYMDLKLKTLENEQYNLHQFHGKVVLLSFWASWCTPCAEELPALDQIQKENSDWLKVITINLDGVPSVHGVRDDNGELILANAGNTPENRSKIDRMVEMHDLKLDIVWDYENKIAPRYKGDDLPTHALYDKSGHLVRVFTGSRTKMEWMELLQAVAQLESPH